MNENSYAAHFSYIKFGASLIFPLNHALLSRAVNDKSGLQMGIQIQKEHYGYNMF